MKILVLIKQVPDSTDVKIDPVTNTLKREGVAAVINPFDMYAIEEAIRVKEKLGDSEVVVICMGPPQADQALREAISMGCDSAILLSDRKFAGSDTWATSYTISQAIKKVGDFGIIFCGKQASDGDTAQVGPGISMHLGIPQVTYVKKIEKLDKTSAVVERMTEEGYDIVETPIPVLFTVVKEINEPRLPSLKGKMKAKKAEIVVWTAEDVACEPENIGLDGSPTRVVKVFSPPPRGGGQIIGGEEKDAAIELAGLIKDVVIGG
ncbi:MAG: electron transfer flavoprotein subunit beta/FixA family protein [Candidatus Omnitrophica bacterium]|nr:electron transfer flavoprotein subunit beta/FixA family protein [Candidatus Omnitrophota bacterium]MDD5487484.1 electron transfer flavoprotein subunit beta/FixA family protein [Candidatus Omnitrophota bacterium]